MSYREFVKKRDELVRELVSSRKLLFQMLIDWCLENGRCAESRGWKYLMEHGKFPSKRKAKGKEKWGWTFTQNYYHYGRDGRTRIEQILESLLDAELRGSTVLPWALLDHQHIVSTPWSTEEEALESAASAMGDLLDEYVPEKRE